MPTIGRPGESVLAQNDPAAKARTCVMTGRGQRALLWCPAVRETRVRGVTTGPCSWRP